MTFQWRLSVETPCAPGRSEITSDRCMWAVLGRPHPSHPRHSSSTCSSGTEHGAAAIAPGTAGERVASPRARTSRSRPHRELRRRQCRILAETVPDHHSRPRSPLRCSTARSAATMPDQRGCVVLGQGELLQGAASQSAAGRSRPLGRLVDTAAPRGSPAQLRPMRPAGCPARGSRTRFFSSSTLLSSTHTTTQARRHRSRHQHDVAVVDAGPPARP